MLDLLTLVKNMRSLKVLIQNPMFFTPEVKAMLKNTNSYVINLEDKEQSDDNESSSSVGD